MRHNIINSFKILALATVLSFGLSYAYAWTAPTSNPPSGNVSAPISTSGATQTKDGNLKLNNWIYANSFRDTGDATDSYFMKPSGDSRLKAIYMPDAANSLISAPKFCMSTNGSNCITAWPGVGGVTKLIAGTGVTISPVSGVGDVTVNSVNTAPSHGKQRFTASGTFTTSAGVTTVWVSAAGGGGGGGGGWSMADGNGGYMGAVGGNGGGGAAVVAEQLAVTPGTSYAITVGTAGTAGGRGVTGGTGGTSRFGALLALGGGSGGIGGTGYYNPNGSAGGAGGSAGGGGIFGVAGLSGSITTVGSSGVGYGAGGGGGGQPGGGAGSPGFVLVEW